MGVFRMGIWRVMVVVIMGMIVIMPVIMPLIMMVMMVVVILRLQTAQPGAEGITQRAISHVRSRRAGALALDMVVMAFLHRANL